MLFILFGPMATSHLLHPSKIQVTSGTSLNDFTCVLKMDRNVRSAMNLGDRLGGGRQLVFAVLLLRIKRPVRTSEKQFWGFAMVILRPTRRVGNGNLFCTHLNLQWP